MFVAAEVRPYVASLLRYRWGGFYRNCGTEVIGRFWLVVCEELFVVYDWTLTSSVLLHEDEVEVYVDLAG
jgi:hypothetical protein